MTANLGYKYLLLKFESIAFPVRLVIFRGATRRVEPVRVHFQLGPLDELFSAVILVRSESAVQNTKLRRLCYLIYPLIGAARSSHC